jgi:TRAP-type mannitol/chloroaromatic compound transport system substrate-binding protein
MNSQRYQEQVAADKLRGHQKAASARSTTSSMGTITVDVTAKGLLVAHLDIREISRIARLDHAHSASYIWPSL